MGRVERAAGQARVRGERLDQLDQFRVALGDRLAEHLPAVRVAEEHPVTAVDVDVLDKLVLQQRLKPADAEPRGMDDGCEVFLLLGGVWFPARVGIITRLSSPRALSR